MRKIFIKPVVFISFLIYIFLPVNALAQSGFVHASGKQILDVYGNNLILRGIGTGNWMLQEGYMMGTGDVAGTQWKFRNLLVQTIGEERTKQFYETWWDNHFRRIDVDSMAAWGFNSVRVAMHYKMFTLPIEEEPVPGQHTWLENGFVRLDSVLRWCADNQMYLILDMHGAPGGQGKDANISDYDTSKPSLWESEANKQKLVELWKKLAKRYADSPWMGGYDLINEPNWTLPNNNKDLWDLYKRITVAIREVDKNHLLILGGNSWGNDYSGLPALWDNNIALSFHKYWNNTDLSTLNFITTLRDQRNVPIWLGESGENSNTWFTEVIELCEANNIGWAWWPVKKTGINNVLRSKSNHAYDQMINAWKKNLPTNADQSFGAVMQFAEDHKFENCIIQKDVIDAMISRPHNKESKPFKSLQVNDVIYATDYDLGPAGVAYYDTEDANYRLSTDVNVNWNRGWVYRNDGVDIESCSDNPTNGYSVGWIEDGEWMQYTIDSPEEKAFSLFFRYASEHNNGKVYIEVNGQRASSLIALEATGGWTNWNTKIIPNIIIPKGKIKVKIFFEKGNVNFNYFQFRVPKDIANVNFEILDAQTDLIKDDVILFFNKPVDEIATGSFRVYVNNRQVEITDATKDTAHSQVIILKVDATILNDDRILLSSGDVACKSGGQALALLNNYLVNNKTAYIHTVPCVIEAEEYINKNGFQFESCSDAGGGLNAAYAAIGSYLEYFLLADYSGEHDIDFRVSVNNSQSRIALYDGETNTFMKQVVFNGTGGWQNWNTQSSTVTLKKGKNLLRLRANTEGFNLNWIALRKKEGMNVQQISRNEGMRLFPNPVSDMLYINTFGVSDASFSLVDMSGKQLFFHHFSLDNPIRIPMNHIPEGIYYLKMLTADSCSGEKVIVRR